jgi:hypothetical protein
VPQTANKINLGFRPLKDAFQASSPWKLLFNRDEKLFPSDASKEFQILQMGC